jgi:succinate dehydrogenase hydrophobic anchor subunit
MMTNFATATFRSSKDSVDYNQWEIKESGLLIGIALFSFESINTVVNVRRTAKLPTQMRMYVRYTFVSASIFFMLFAASYHLVYGKNTMNQIAFDYYNKTNILHLMKYLVMLNPIFSVPFNIISTVEIFEKVKPMSFMVRDKAMNLSATRIQLSRQALLTCVFSLSMLTSNISKILDLVGSLFGPILGLIIPVS